MTTLILQTAALLLCAYFLGAWVACLIRRTWFADADEVASGVGATAPRATATAADTGTRVAPPSRRPDPKPIALETIERAAPHAASDAASRFEDVLTTAPKQVAPATPAPAPAAKPVAPAVVPAAASAATTNTGAIAQAAAAATAAAVAVAKPVTPAAPPVHMNFPAASSGAGPSAVSAPLAPPSAVVAPLADDLTRIRAIDPALQQRLAKLGVARYRDIAGWLPVDVERVSRELGFTGRIEQENWIEQAQILARGGETAYARRKASGEIANAAPSANQGVAKPVAPAPAPAVTSSPQVESRAAFSHQPSTAVPVPAQPAAAPAAVAPKPAAPAPAPVAATTPAAPAQPPAAPAAVAPKPAAPAPAPVAAATPAAPAPAAPAPAPAQPAAAPAAVAPKPAAPAPAPVAAATPAQVVPAVGMAAATAAAAAAGLGAAAGVGRDNLQRIGGINAEVERLLNVQGVSRYGQIAGWSAAEAGRFDRLLGHAGRVSREGWIEQATTLASGGDTAFSRQFDQRAIVAKAAPAASPAPVAPAQAAPAPAVAAPVVDAPRPSRLADAIRDTAVKPAAETATATAATAVATAAAAAAGAAASATGSRASDLSGMRSVRSEAYSPQIGAKSTGHDDLKRIRGVGVLIEKKLNSMGVSSYAQVANWSAADIDRVSQVLDFKGRIERENWVEQARILSAGGQTEFSRRVDRGEVETSRS